MSRSPTHLVTLADGEREFQFEGKRVIFSPYRLFNLISQDSVSLAKICQLLAAWFSSQDNLYICCRTGFFNDLRLRSPELHALSLTIVNEMTLAALANERRSSSLNIFIAEIDARDIFSMNFAIKEMFSNETTVRDFSCLAELYPTEVPSYAWGQYELSIYPLDVPKIEFKDSLDVLLLDCPARNLSLMPNGLAYVHNALKKTEANYQTFDLDVITYHNYHIHRLHNLCDKVILPSGLEMPEDPWQAHNYDLWEMPEVIDYFGPLIVEVADKIAAASPKILALSIQQCNEKFSRRLINLVKARVPDTIILLGGYSCYSPDIGLRAFPEADYMCVGEADLSIGPLVDALINDEQVANMPGVISKNDDPSLPFIPAPMQHNLDELDFPKYEWNGTDIYVNFNGYRLTPVIASRGCRWSRCTFCAERFYWRIRSPKNFVDELEWLIAQGCHDFMFNESDLNGNPEMLLSICDEIISRGLKVSLSGQLRIQKQCTRAYFDKLKEAGFASLRFGIDAFSTNSLRLQKKGYTKETISKVLRDCYEAGIPSEINWVIGVPGETEEDIDEGIDFICQNKKYIGRIANINPLILGNGSVYWLEPEEHNIKFRLPREELYARYFRAIPAHLWYSDEPYIDGAVRKKWYEKIVIELHEQNFTIGDWAQRVIDNVQKNKDATRTATMDATDIRSNDLPSPQLLDNYKGFNLYQMPGQFFAVPENIIYLDFMVTGQPMTGVIVDLSERAIKQIIDESLDWANTRSTYQKVVSEETASNLGLRLSTQYEDVAAFVHDHRFFVIPLKEIEAKFGPKSTHAYSIANYSLANWAGRGVWRAGNHKIIHSLSGFFAVPLSVPRMEAYMVDDLMRYGIHQFVYLSDAIQYARNVAKESQNCEQVTPNPSDVESSSAEDESSSFGPAFGTFFARPTVLDEINGYAILGYEGFVYGLPQKYRDVDLTEVDVMAWPDVIRDVSQDAVAEQIQELCHAQMVYGQAQTRN